MATSTVGSLVTEKVADPPVTAAPATDWSPLPVTRYTVEPATIDGDDTVTLIAGKLPVTFTPFSNTPKPKVTTTDPPPVGTTADDEASVITTWTGPVKAPAGTVAPMLAVPTVADAVPPPGWTVVVEATVPARPVAVPPTPGAAAGV